ncbi:hypothetical protein Y032_0322g2452 [Ancylostoma ceylanicum]|uniref:Uncharacterized protein n=1 Tax=Ancylostoma ceylanicum TaxID=53326 RepID=A0A016S109_9BILA|nr:hypothetical protein Y032_0322g2452 [Ancylostoma ceylanicum]
MQLESNQVLIFDKSSEKAVFVATSLACLQKMAELPALEVEVFWNGSKFYHRNGVIVNKNIHSFHSTTHPIELLH